MEEYVTPEVDEAKLKEIERDRQNFENRHNKPASTSYKWNDVYCSKCQKVQYHNHRAGALWCSVCRKRSPVHIGI